MNRICYSVLFACVLVPAIAAQEVTSQSIRIALDGIRTTLVLNSEVSSKLATGTPFRATLRKPIQKGEVIVVPAGTVFQGQLRTVKARRRMHAGSVVMVFEQMVIPGQMVEPVVANVVSISNDAVKTSAEGELRPTISKKRLSLQLGGATAIAKLSDDISELIGGTTVSASTARYAGLAGAATFFLLQKGREVKLHPGDEIAIEFGR